jgi:RND family efflux transporter MFP subunit
VARLVRYDPVRLRLEVPERQAHEVRLGQEARVELEGRPEPLLARVDRLSPELDAQNRTLSIELDLENADGALLPGSFARASLVVDAQARTLVVPRAALVRFAGIDKVFVVEEGRAIERPITVGRSEPERVEVLEGLEPGAQVVLSPGGLSTGAEVRVE